MTMKAQNDQHMFNKPDVSHPRLLTVFVFFNH